MLRFVRGLLRAAFINLELCGPLIRGPVEVRVI